MRVITIFPTCEFFKEWNEEKPIFTEKLNEAYKTEHEEEIIEIRNKLRKLKYCAYHSNNIPKEKFN